MFKASILQNCLKNLLGWKNHFDLTEISALTPTLNASDSGEYYGDYHPALRLDLIEASLPEGRALSDYLTEKISTGITQLGNQIFTEKKLNDFSRELLGNGTIINGHGWANDTIINEGRFVGFKIKESSDIGVKTIINRLGFQFTLPQTALNIYVYHSSKVDPVQILPFTSTKGLEWGWMDTEIDLSFNNDDMSGGSWFVGYYQDDITGQAIQYKKMNWKTGFCSTCNGGRDYSRWNTIKKYVSVVPIYVPAASINANKTVFELDAAFSTYDNNHGMNLNVSVKCDLSDFLCEHKMLLKNALAKKVTYLILRDIQFSQQINYIEENLKNLIIRDLEGDRDTYHTKIVTQLDRAVKAIDIDTNSLSKDCMPCTKKIRVRYGVA